MQTRSEAGSEPLTATPLDVLAEELGGIAARIERELRQQVALELERVARAYAEAQLRIKVLEQTIEQRLAEIKDGEPGAPGERGQPGLDGENGKDGRDGIDGKDGSNGKDGQSIVGPQGPPGQMPIAKAHVPGDVYYAGEVVSAASGTYQATRNTAQPLDHADWVCLAARGADGRSLTPRGLFDPAATYAAGDVIAGDGGSFVALKDSPGAFPGPGWQQLATRGKPGSRGEPGPAGARGPAGADAPAIVGWRRAHYAAIPILSDGSEGPALELRTFFEAYHAERESA